MTKERAMLVSMFVLFVAVGGLWLSLAGAKDRTRNELHASCLDSFKGEESEKVDFIKECMN